MVAVKNEKKQQSAHRPVKSGGESVSTETVARIGAVLSPGRKKGLTGEPKKGEPAPKTAGPKAEEPAQPTEPAEEKEERLSPKDVDYQSPLVICLSIITRLAGNPVSAATLKAGLPQSNNIVTAASLVRAAVLLPRLLLSGLPKKSALLPKLSIVRKSLIFPNLSCPVSCYCAVVMPACCRKSLTTRSGYLFRDTE